MTNKIIQQLEAEQMSKEIPTFAPGDTIIVQVKVKEGERSVCRRSKASLSPSVTAV